VNLRVRENDGHGVIADGRYQSPILVQWHAPVGARQSRGDNLLSPVCPHHGVADSTETYRR